MKYLKVYGLHRTGTNYLFTLLCLNFKNINLFMNLGGFKHGNLIKFPKEEDILNKYLDMPTHLNYKDKVESIKTLFEEEKVIFLVTVKNPYLWIISHAKFHGSEFCNKNIVRFSKHWSEMYAKYAESIKDGTAHLVKYEDVLTSYDNFLDNLQKKYDLEKNHTEYINIDKEILPCKDSELGKHNIKNFFTKRDYYLNPDLEKIYTTEQISLINQNLDKNVMEFYNYSFYSLAFNNKLD